MNTTRIMIFKSINSKFTTLKKSSSIFNFCDEIIFHRSCTPLIKPSCLFSPFFRLQTIQTAPALKSHPHSLKIENRWFPPPSVPLALWSFGPHPVVSNQLSMQHLISVTNTLIQFVTSNALLCWGRRKPLEGGNCICWISYAKILALSLNLFRLRSDRLSFIHNNYI